MGEMEITSVYVVEDRITIKCAMTVIKKPCDLEEAELPANSHDEVPPSNITEHLGKYVTSEVKGEEFLAHKLVLAMRSLVFKAALYRQMREKD
jgi:speckle-type POZ protein